MTFWCVAAKSYFGDDKDIGAVHSLMFEGIAKRGGEWYSFDSEVCYEEESTESLLLWRSGHFIPEVFRPSSNLVATSKCCQALQILPHIRFLPVVFERFVDVYYAPGDHSYEEREDYMRRYREMEFLILEAPVMDKPIVEVGEYYEIIPPTAKYLNDLSQDTDLNTLTFQLGYGRGLETVEIEVNTQLMLKDYPVVKYGKEMILCTIWRQDAFEIIEHYLDRQFFLVAECE